MSLAGAKAGLKSALLAMVSTTDPKSQEQAAQDLTDAIDTYVSAATVTVAGTGLSRDRTPLRVAPREGSANGRC